MENSDFETILTVKEFDRCCTFYQGLLANAEICVGSSFLMKFKLSNRKSLKICAVNPLEKNFVQQSTLLTFELDKHAVEHAVEYLLRHNLRFITENNIIRITDPSGNILIIKAADKCDFNALRPDNRTKKVQIL